MPSKKLQLKSFIRSLRHNEFMQLYVQLTELTKKYATTTNNEFIVHFYEKMQKEVTRVKQLGVELKAASDTVVKRNEVHGDIRDSIKYIKYHVKGYLLGPSQSYRAHAAYIDDKLEGLIVLQSVSSIGATLTTMARIRAIIEQDVALANALLELDLMERIEILYKQGEEFEQLHMQKSIESVTAPVIDKRTIRREATNTLKGLFTAIEVNYSLTDDEVWVEMAEEVEGLAFGSGNA